MSLKVACLRWKVCAVGYPSPIGMRKRTTCGQRIFSCEQARFLCGYPVECHPALDYPLGFRIPQSIQPQHCSSTTKAPRHQREAAQNRSPPVDRPARTHLHRTVLARPLEFPVPAGRWCLGDFVVKCSGLTVRLISRFPDSLSPDLLIPLSPVPRFPVSPFPLVP